MFDFICLTSLGSLVIAGCVTHLYVLNIIELIALLLLFVSLLLNILLPQCLLLK